MPDPDDNANCRLEYDEASIAWLCLDCRGAATNTLAMPVLRDLAAALDELERREGLAGLVLLSAKPAGFATAPSREEMERIRDAEHLRALIRLGQTIADRIAALPVPTVALVHGHCHGGGLELALACRYRIADQASARIGFPDVHLGLHPCHGGTARLPALIGPWPALKLLRTGRFLGAAEAARLGLVDAAIARDRLQDAARDRIARKPRRQRPAPWNLVFFLRVARWIVHQVIDSELRRTPRPEYYPTTYAVLRLWRDHAGRRMGERLDAECRSLLRLAERPRTRNLVRSWLLQDRLQRDAARLETPPPTQVHVFGAGTIGSGLAALLALYGRGVTLHDPDGRALNGALERAERIAMQHVGDPQRAADARARIATDGGMADVERADFVIEAIDEDPAAKRTLLRQLEAVLDPGAVIATSSATCLVEELCTDMERPGRLIGLHCARPVEFLGLIEVVAGERSEESALAAGQALVTSVHKLALRVRSSPGFLVMRLQLPYMLEGATMYTRPRREIIEAAGRKFGMPHGPLELADSVGLDLCARLAERIGHPVPEPLHELVAAGRLGHRSGQGFHDWKGARRVIASIPPGDHQLNSLGRRLIAPILREAERCRDEQVVADADLVDVGGLFGAGFPNDTGGPLNYLRERRWEIAEQAGDARWSLRDRVSRLTRVPRPADAPDRSREP